ncbi:MAG: bifunctional methylenetetrahydrofolate dehydrogenase/methenyltetrahydrofolate cyclohydrolase FolD [Christensenellales bacterium]|jgi:methylenetetrahydrofolate dehydrogenase (NADP+)/methenyltetrahydrofolate cyclohydrolase
MGKLISGRKIADKVKQELKAEVEALADKGITPGLAVIFVGDNPASEIYVRNKEASCKELAIDSKVVKLSEYISQAELLEVIEELNHDNAVDGILVQLPLPNHIDTDVIMDAIDPAKDVDGIHAMNAGLLMGGRPVSIACTPKGVLRMLKEADIRLSGANAVVVGRSNIVGKPMAMLLLNESCTVTICHSRTKNLAEICKGADILVAAVGIAKFITADMIKEGAAVIDVGINRGEDGKVVGDVDYEAAKEVAGYITKVPGGVGPMTIAMLMENTIEAAKRHGNI